jgi:hypothetical protein
MSVTWIEVSLINSNVTVDASEAKITENGDLLLGNLMEHRSSGGFLFCAKAGYAKGTWVTFTVRTNDHNTRSN